jgi:predicted NBD/HSP70 family sugar kinase
MGQTCGYLSPFSPCAGILALGGVLIDNTDEHSDHAVPNENHAVTRRSGGQRADHVTIRRYNRQLILSHLRNHGPTSRVAIAKSLGMSRATVSSIISELKEDGLVREGDKVSATKKGGKRATLVHFNENAGYIVGVDLGRSRIRVYLTNLETKIVGQLSALFDIRVGWEGGLEFIVANTDKLVRTRLRTWNLVRGIGLSIPGTLDRTAQRLISPPLFLDWSNVDIPTYLRQKLSLNESFPIYLDKDANMGALGESRYGGGLGIENLIYVKLSTGISAGLILNGKLYRGNNGVAGEFGHVLFNEESSPCPSCGKHGCLEAVAGLNAIVEDAQRGVSLLRNEYSEEADATSELMADVIIEAEKGDSVCRTALIRAGEHIGKAIGSYLINVYNPSMILLDGGIVRPNKGDVVFINKLLLESLYRNAEDSSLPAAWAGTLISTGGLGDDAVGLGAVATVLDRDPELNMPS